MTVAAIPLLDLLVATMLVWIAWRALASPDLFKAVVLFIAFGLLLAVAWVRLGAPDVALAEAAIGAGLTGALLLDAVGHLRPPRSTPRRTVMTGQVDHARTARGRLAVVGLAGGLGATLIAPMLDLPIPPTQLAVEVDGALTASGVRHPVTAVLLNFRSYDTLLEIAVLVAALLAAAALATPSAVSVRDAASPVLEALPHVVVPVAVLTAAYLLWAGTTQPGGAFQAGAVLGGAGVLLYLAGWRPPLATSALGVRAGVLVGLVVFLAVALAVAAPARTFLTYPRTLAEPLIVAIEVTLTVSIGLILVTLFVVASRTGATSGPDTAGDEGKDSHPGAQS